ncbi:MAG: efflux RND transporter periplasmic adaptor subunit [Azoarcus sp.]|nr:efflux RND transporter periplasmic adaptor subunit [Azoarcus sp.]
MRRLLALGILLLAVAGFIALRATRPEPPAVEVRERVWPVAVAQAVPQSARPTLTLYGRIEAPDRVRASAPVAGRILTLAVRDGDFVEAGAVLAQLDPRDLQPRVERARADLEREVLRAEHDRRALVDERRLLELSKAKLARFERLTRENFGSAATTDQAREDVARARLAVNQREQSLAEHPARLAQARTELAEAERDVERGEITAPFAARIGVVEAAAGDQVQAGATLMTLYPSDDLFLRARVPAQRAAELRAALAAGETLVAHAEYGETGIAARLERIAGEADARGVEALLRVEAGRSVPVGAFVSAEMDRPVVSEVLSLPFSALHGGDRIYRIEDGRLAAVQVERVGEHRVDGEPRVLLRAPSLPPGSTVMITHLPNAIDGLAVESLEQ